jgi:hypothetical protein
VSLKDAPVELDTSMPSILRFSQPDTGTSMSARSDIYGRPDLYDMEYEGASNHDAHFFARLLARVRPRRVLELACDRAAIRRLPVRALRPHVALCGHHGTPATSVRASSSVLAQPE